MYVVSDRNVIHFLKYILFFIQMTIDDSHSFLYTDDNWWLTHHCIRRMWRPQPSKWSREI